MCTDGINNDCDLDTDCEDSDCDSDPACICSPKGASCSIGSDCCSGSCTPQYHPADTQSPFCEIDMGEVMAFVGLWLLNSQEYPMRELMEAIGYYYSGSYC